MLIMFPPAFFGGHQNNLRLYFAAPLAGAPPPPYRFSCFDFKPSLNESLYFDIVVFLKFKCFLKWLLCKILCTTN